jgi:tRNA pseudouridine65 synthase
LLQWVRDAVGQHVFAVHRLDKPTAGLMAFATSPEAASLLSRAFRERRVAKRYAAIVRGHVDSPFDVDYPLGAVRDRHARSGDEPKDAVTRVSPIGQSEIGVPVGRYQTARYTLAVLSPLTGRRHQLRRHMKHVFHPIIGDRKYGDRDHNRFLEAEGFRRLALCSIGLEIEGLETDFCYSTTPDQEWLAMAGLLGLDFSLLPKSY